MVCAERAMVGVNSSGLEVAALVVIAAVTFFGNVLSQEQGAVAGLSTSISCRFGRQEQAPFWIINETVYELFTIPRIFPYIPIVDSYSTLQIPVVPLLLNNTTFQCAIFDEESVNFVDSGVLTRLIVAPNPDGEGNGGFEDIVISDLVVDFQHLFVFLNSTSVTWFVNENKTCSRDFQVRGYTISSTGPVLSDDHIFNVSNTNMYRLPSSQYISSVGMDIDYRLVSLNKACPSNRDVFYYRLSDSEALEWRVFNPDVNSTACYPNPNICVESLNFYFDNHGCPVHNSILGHINFQSCTNGYADDMLVPELTGSGEVCFSNLSSASMRNETLFHYLCSTDPCADEECLLRTMISSYIVIFAGPPSTPDIDFNSSFLCFSAYAHEEFPVQTFDVEITDITGIPTTLGGSYDSRGPLCLNVTADDLCLPFEVSVSATNAIGTNSTTEFITLLNGGIEDDASDVLCSCYLGREQIKFDVTSTDSGSVIISLSCSRTISSSLNYILENQNTNERNNFSIECGGSITLPDLAATTDYYISQGFGETECTVKQFTTEPNTTPTTPPTPSGSIVAEVVIAVVILVTIILAVIIISTFLVYIKRRRGTLFVSVIRTSNIKSKESEENEDEEKS